MSEVLGTLSVLGFSFSAVLAVIAVIYFFTQHIRKVHDDLTGRTAQRAIAELRDNNRSRARFFGSEDRNAAGRAAREKRALGLQSGELVVHMSENASNPTGRVTSRISDAETGTTIIGESEALSAGDSESGTTLLTPHAASEEEAESGTTLLTPNASADAVEGGIEDAPRILPGQEGNEFGTTLLTPHAASEEDDGSATTLLDVTYPDDVDEFNTTLLNAEEDMFAEVPLTVEEDR